MNLGRVGLGVPIVVLAGCALVGQTSPSVVAPTYSPASMATASPTATPTATPTNPPTTPPTQLPTAEPTPSPTVPPYPVGRRPPDGLLASGGESIAGSLGSFCWNDCADGPTAPKETLPELIASGDTLAFAMEDGTLIYEWYAHYSTWSNSSVTLLGSGCCWVDPYSSEPHPPAVDHVEFPAPPPGDWVVHVSVWFAWGDAFYAWRVEVPS